MNREFSTDVLICGAGPAGLTLAVDLARRGVRFGLIEKMDEPFRGSRGKGIQPRTQEVFEDLGILDRIAAAGGPYPPQREYYRDGTMTDSPPFVEQRAPTPSEPYGTPFMIPQFLTEGVMRARLVELGHLPLFGCELVDIEQGPSGVTARVTTQGTVQTVRARYLIGADGGRSFVRHALDIGFPGATLDVRALVADTDITGFSRDVWHRFNDGPTENWISVCPLAGTRLFQLQAPLPLQGEVDLSAEGLTAMVTARTGRNGITINSVYWASAFKMNARLADKYRVGRIFLVGDAAHIHPPTGGQGLNTSVQDSYNLSWKLAAVLGGAPDSLLDTYEDERRPIAADVLGLSTELLSSATQGKMRRSRAEHQLDISYRESVLALEMPRRTRGVRAGDRAPDASVRGAAGRSARLFDLFMGPHWTMLCYGVSRPAIPISRQNLRIHAVGGDGDMDDVDGEIRDGYGVAAGDIILVRPDGYVGAIVSAEEMSVLDAYMREVGLHESPAAALEWEHEAVEGSPIAV